MRTFFAWLLWLWMAVVLWAAFSDAAPAAGFMGESSRILYFHVPMAWTAFIAFFAAAFWSLLYLARGRQPRHDRAGAVAIEIGLCFCILATVTGALWAKVEWGAFWNWDPRQISIILVLVFYGAYLALRSAVEDPERRARLSAVYALLGVVVTPFFFFIVPRITFSLHPDPILNSRGKIDMDGPIALILLGASVGFTALFFWMHSLDCRVRALTERD